MSMPATFKPWHSGLWLSFFLTTMSGLVSNYYWQEWASEYRAQVALDIRPYTPDADYILYYATRRWLPLPWKSSETSLRENMIQIERSIRLKYDEFEAPELTNVSWSDFKQLVSQWDARNKACQIVTQLNVSNNNCNGSERLPSAWIDYFEKTFYQSYFISYVDGRPVFGQRQSNDIRYCNTSPITSNFTVLQQLASPNLTEFYRVAMQHTQYPLKKMKTEILFPGACRHLRVTSYDMPVEAVFNVAPENSEVEAWFFDNWKRYHATWLNNPEFYENLVNHTRQTIATTLCDNVKKSEGVDDTGVSVERLDAKNCEWGGPQEFLYGQHLSSPKSIFFASNYPGFSDYSQYLDDTGVLKNDELNSILQEARELAPIVRQQFALAQKWDSTIPRFELGAILNNTSGPFVKGVDASQIPQTTILDDVVEIPRQGLIYELNGREIYSEADIHEALTKHGDEAGIMLPITVNVFNENAEITSAGYITRFQFNPQAWQSFDTEVSSFEIGSYGLLLKSARFNCMVRDLFTDLKHSNIEQCAWVDQQRFAYAKQMNPEAFNSSLSLGSISGMIAVLGGFLKGLGKIRDRP